jgi:outer membrane immunogenic protein
MIVKLTCLSAALLASTSLASAQGAAKAPFDGPFAGLGAGALNDKVGRVGILGTLEDQDQWSADVTAFAGYDYALPYNFVVGVEGAGAYSVNDDQNIGGTAGAFKFDPQYELNFTGRFGYLIRPDVLVYARGGYTNLHGDVEPTGAAGADHNSHIDGWLVGGGIEYSFFENLSARAEYRYQDLSKSDFDLERNQAFVGISYRF